RVVIAPVRDGFNHRQECFKGATSGAGVSPGGAVQVTSSRNIGDTGYSCSSDSNAIVGVFNLHMHVAAKADVACRFDLVGQPDAFDATKSSVDFYLRNP